jgi:predicted N-formylglutamate amidohydrolase
MKIILSCEHASAALPATFQHLFEDNDQVVLWSHRGWDPGALRLARVLELALDAPLVRGEWSRLLLDLNRSHGNPNRWSEYSCSLPDSQKQELESLIFEPYWAELYGNIKAAIEEGSRVLHLSIHSFVRVLNNKEREVDLGILFDPVRTNESSFSNSLISQLQEELGVRFRVLPNVPYAGTDDGLTKMLRTLFADEQYLGIEIEVCSDLLEDTNSVERLGAVLASSIWQVTERV